MLCHSKCLFWESVFCIIYSLEEFLKRRFLVKQGRLHMYRLDESDWTFILADVKFWVWDSKFQEVSLEEVLFEEHVDMVKIVAKNPPRS